MTTEVVKLISHMDTLTKALKDINDLLNKVENALDKTYELLSITQEIKKTISDFELILKATVAALQVAKCVPAISVSANSILRVLQNLQRTVTKIKTEVNRIDSRIKPLRDNLKKLKTTVELINVQANNMHHFAANETSLSDQTNNSANAAPEGRYKRVLQGSYEKLAGDMSPPLSQLNSCIVDEGKNFMKILEAMGSIMSACGVLSKVVKPIIEATSMLKQFLAPILILVKALDKKIKVGVKPFVIKFSILSIFNGAGGKIFEKLAEIFIKPFLSALNLNINISIPGMSNITKEFKLISNKLDFIKTAGNSSSRELMNLVENGKNPDFFKKYDVASY